MRSCGECFTCCVLPSIPEVEKPEGVACKHLADGKCSIYETRPQVCRDFECGFRMQDRFKDDDRPDLVGLLVMGQKVRHAKLNVVHEIKDGALASWKGQRLLRREAHGQILGVQEYGKPRTLEHMNLIGPPTLIRKLNEVRKSLVSHRTAE